MPKDSSKSSKSKRASRPKCVPYARGFRPPNFNQQIEAIGFGPKLCSMPVEYRDEESKHGNNFFASIPHPTSEDDWLAQYAEEGQTFREYKRENPWFSKRKHKFIWQDFVSTGNNICEKYPRGKIYIANLEDFCAVSFDDLLDYAAKFLCIPVQKLGGIEIKDVGGQLKFIKHPSEKESNGTSRSTPRIQQNLLEVRCNHKTGHLQIKVDSILPRLRSIIPDDALCLIALTEYDLFGDEPDLFVAGMASGNERVAVFSLYRYDPGRQFSKEFWYEVEENDSAPQEKERLMLQRSCKLVVHEICHLLGIDHCIYYNCCMNGSGHLEEDFRQPMMLCPVDLHKLQVLVGFEVILRYKALLDFYTKKGLVEEAEWTERRLQFLRQMHDF